MFRFKATVLRRIGATVAVSVAALSGATLFSSAASAADAEPKPSVTLTLRDSKLGQMIADDKGMAIYMFVLDQRNVSNCEGGCLTAWPPVMLKEKETLANVKLEGGLRRSLLGVAMRVDGSRHVTYNSYPLYWWARDKVAGDITGQWVGGTWFVLSGAGHPNSGRL